MKKYVLDTNVILGDPNAVLAFEGAHVILPFKVLEELDSIKSRKVDISRDARVAIRNISTILENATHEEISTTGVEISKTHPHIKGDTRLFVLTIEELTAIHHLANPDLGAPIVDAKLETLMKSTVPDDEIILVAKLSQSVLVTRDINMRIKALAYGVEVQDYRHDITIEDSDLIHTGHHPIEGDFWEHAGDTVYSNQEGQKLIQMIPEEVIKPFLPENLCIGDYIYDEADGLFVFEGYISLLDADDDRDYLGFSDVGQSKALSRKVWDIKAKNIQQAMAINSIMDKDVHITVLLGSAGTGKTLITVATALELVLEKRKYDRIIFSKTQDSQFEEIGFLPGSEMEKVMPFCGAAIDALEYLHKDDANPQGSIEEIMKRNIFQFKALNFVRGRSFINTILIVDEFQNITPAQAKTILTRAGENCKVIIMGNLSQIDNKFISPTNSGLTYVTEKFKDWEGCRIIELEGVVRSPLAAFAEENL
ncbi:PhoH-like phosphate starvation-inducible [Pectobacterium phage vB_PcaM_CBB]|uniref:PhoH family protein n=1 Tax=Pectobacterium phage vB_PcaM_CBB TaxID=2772511 RepID=A0A1L2CUJ9_9CAUD|nr:PhoH-like phosphate starvation-inducible [Pectobacterium phage vB_PcaM_CBB]AMM43688.1 PhoH family protein [Pectobacterium phage vB_PcaM_CBB]